MAINTLFTLATFMSARPPRCWAILRLVVLSGRLLKSEWRAVAWGALIGGRKAAEITSPCAVVT